MTGITLVGWAFAFISLAGAAVFFWREKKIAGLAFIIVFIVVLAGVSEKRVVLTSAMLGITLEHDADLRPASK
jgi:O-antigen ligase